MRRSNYERWGQNYGWKRSICRKKYWGGGTALEKTLDAMNETIADLKARITELEAETSGKNHFVILYPGGTESKPPTIKTNERVVCDNPFPGYHVMCKTQILVNNKWGWGGHHTATSYGRFVHATQLLPDDVIVIQSGRNYISGESNLDGNPFETSSPISTAKYRVLVYKLGKITEE